MLLLLLSMVEIQCPNSLGRVLQRRIHLLETYALKTFHTNKMKVPQLATLGACMHMRDKMECILFLLISMPLTKGSKENKNEKKNRKKTGLSIYLFSRGIGKIVTCCVLYSIGYCYLVKNACVSST